jgi:sarcosine oxidase subunit gamma
VSAPETVGPEPATPLAAILTQGRRGAASPAGVTLNERRVALVEVSARRGRAADLSATLRAALGVALPEPGRASTHDDVAALWIAPETTLVVGPLTRLQAVQTAIAPAIAAVVDQSGGYVVLRLAGPQAAAALAKGCRVDLDARAFGADCVARTIIAQMPAIVHRIAADPAFDLFVPMTFARSFAEFLLHAADEFGCDVGEPA